MEIFVDFFMLIVFYLKKQLVYNNFLKKTYLY
jgi:hypothetical protein